jgi:hypothetical protein
VVFAVLITATISTAKTTHADIRRPANRRYQNARPPRTPCTILWGHPTEVLIETLIRHDAEGRHLRTRLVEVGLMAGPDVALPAAVLRSAGLEIVGMEPGRPEADGASRPRSASSTNCCGPGRSGPTSTGSRWTGSRTCGTASRAAGASCSSPSVRPRWTACSTPRSPRSTRWTDKGIIAGLSGRGVPPPAHADALSRKTPP